MVVQYLHAYCKAVHGVHEANDHASVTPLAVFVVNENSSFKDIVKCDTFLEKEILALVYKLELPSLPSLPLLS